MQWLELLNYRSILLSQAAVPFPRLVSFFLVIRKEGFLCNAFLHLIILYIHILDVYVHILACKLWQRELQTKARVSDQLCAARACYVP